MPDLVSCGRGARAIEVGADGLGEVSFDAILIGDIDGSWSSP